MANYKNDKEIIDRIEEHFEETKKLNYNIFFTALQGSQNYGKDMWDEYSDVDSKSIILPTLEDIALNKQLASKTHICKNEEHIDIKDVRLFFQSMRKQSVNILELLFSKYIKVNPKYTGLFSELTSIREEIAHLDEKRNLMAALGTIWQKQKALCHRYEGIKDKIDKYGFDGKQLSHALRLLEFIEKYTQGYSYQDSITVSDGPYLVQVKRNQLYTKEEAIHLMDSTEKKAKQIIDNYKAAPVNYKLQEKLDGILVGVMKKSIKDSL